MSIEVLIFLVGREVSDTVSWLELEFGYGSHKYNNYSPWENGF